MVVKAVFCCFLLVVYSSRCTVKRFWMAEEENDCWEDWFYPSVPQILLLMTMWKDYFNLRSTEFVLISLETFFGFAHFCQYISVSVAPSCFFYLSIFLLYCFLPFIFFVFFKYHITLNEDMWSVIIISSNRLDICKPKRLRRFLFAISPTL